MAKKPKIIDKTMSAREALDEATVRIQGAWSIADAVTTIRALAASIEETAVVAAQEVAKRLPENVFEWMLHLDLHLTEHDDRHARMALRAAWPTVRAYLLALQAAQPPLESPGQRVATEDEFRHILARYDDDEIDSREFYRSLASRLPERATPPCTYPDCEKRAALELRCLLAQPPLESPGPAEEYYTLVNELDHRERSFDEGILSFRISAAEHQVLRRLAFLASRLPERATPPEGMVRVSRDQIIHLQEYWNGSRNDAAMWDALNHIMDELQAMLAAWSSPANEDNNQ